MTQSHDPDAEALTHDLDAVTQYPQGLTHDPDPEALTHERDPNPDPQVLINGIDP